ncbi:hypothetical protein PMAYCL1PPCAC_18643, partial [Pristionchus mayeri]
NEKVQVMAGQIFELLNAIFYSGAIVGLPLMAPSWMNEVMRRMRMMRFIRDPPSRLGIPKGKESDTYFDDLHSVWNTR